MLMHLFLRIYLKSKKLKYSKPAFVMRKIKSLLTILLVLLAFNDATLWSQAKTVTLYISDDDSKSGQESDPTSWKTSRNLVSDHEYVGEVSNGLPSGQGTETFPGGVEYVGSFKDGKRNGQGTMTLPEGRVFSGFWRDGKFIGKELLEQRPPKITSAMLYIGEENTKSGQESDPASWKTSRNSESDHEYVGEIRNGLPNGVGSYSDPDGLK